MVMMTMPTITDSDDDDDSDGDGGDLRPNETYIPHALCLSSMAATVQWKR